MKKTFDDLIKEIVGENLMAATPQQNSQAYQKSPSAQPIQQKPAQPNNQQGDDELLKVLQQKLQDEKFKQQLMQLLNPQQPTPAQ
jgi:hypothetical protein